MSDLRVLIPAVTNQLRILEECYRIASATTLVPEARSEWEAMAKVLRAPVADEDIIFAAERADDMTAVERRYLAQIVDHPGSDMMNEVAQGLGYFLRFDELYDTACEVIGDGSKEVSEVLARVAWRIEAITEEIALGALRAWMLQPMLTVWNIDFEQGPGQLLDCGEALDILNRFVDFTTPPTAMMLQKLINSDEMRNWNLVMNSVLD